MATSSHLLPKAQRMKDATWIEGPAELPGALGKGTSGRSGAKKRNSPEGLENELTLLSWLIVLLRTREDTQFWFEWALQSNEDEEAPVYRVQVGEIVTDLNATVKQTLAKISTHMKESGHSPNSSSHLLLSTASLARTSNEILEEPLLHIRARYRKDRLEVVPIWRDTKVLDFTVSRHVETLADILKICLINDAATLTIADCLKPTQYDLDQVWSWNRTVPPTLNYCMHDVVSEVAQTYPDKDAIDSWDGRLTYTQMDRFSTMLARTLITTHGVQNGDFVGLCFEKSRWTIVAVLAVMKAGATMAMMDPSLPLARLQNMAEQIGTKTILCSLSQFDFSNSILPSGKIIPVGEGSFTDSATSPEDLPPLPKVDPSTLMYIIFTSGSTGTPKGVQISHRVYTSSAIPRAEAVGYCPDSRTLDFASYAFDVSIDSMLLTVANGGTLCIPSDEARLNDINGVMRDMRVNYAGITPSVARILDIEVIASLTCGLGLGGEAVSARDANYWGQFARIIIGYGPCECTIGCTINSSAATGRDYITIGPGNGAAIWVVDPNDHEVLMPVGAVGELLVEGPIVGEGYLNDEEKTKGVFIHDPSWLLAGNEKVGVQGRKGRLYKTGDLGRYDPAGTGEIVFVGRKDTQVKLRGQRVELGEIESQLKARLPREANVIVEVVKTSGSSQSTLVAFMASHSGKGPDGADIELVHKLPEDLRERVNKAAKEIGEVLPRYMVPNAYIPVNFIPTLISGKTDRKRLRAFAGTVDLRDLDEHHEVIGAEGGEGQNGTTTTEDHDRELTEMEQRLKDGWIQVLKLDPSTTTIHADSNFFALGGDSLSAMKLVSLCREGGLDLSVTDTFGKPSLAAMAKVLRVIDSAAAHHQTKQRPPFAMISPPHSDACAAAARLCEGQVRPSDIQDIYPCTATQESLITFSLKAEVPYVAQRVALIPSHITTSAWKKAWETVIAATPILRTRVAQLDLPGDTSHGLKQVVLKQPIVWNSAANLSQYLEQDRKERMDLGQPLARYGIVDDEVTKERHMVWTLHHVVYDGWSEPLVLAKIRDALNSTTTTSVQQGVKDMGDFVQFLQQSVPLAETQLFWKNDLAGASNLPQFPQVPSRDFIPTPDTIIERQVALPSAENLQGKKFPFTLATLIRAAWALVTSQYTRSSDIIFGETLTGRDIPLSGVESIIGPLIATVPIRIRIDRTQSIETYLRSVQDAILARTSHQHMGMQNIRRCSPDAMVACEAPMGLVIQPEGNSEVSGLVEELGFEVGDVVREAIHFNPYSLMLACGIPISQTAQEQVGGFRVAASFDSSVVSKSQMERILAQFEQACVMLMRGSMGSGKNLAEIGCLVGADELEKIWTWNQVAPLSKSMLKVPGAAYPPAAVPWVCDASNPEALVPIGCAGQLWLEGDLLSLGTESLQNPAWLVAGCGKVSGRQGVLHATGDIVTLQEDGSLVFLGTMGDAKSLDSGHFVDVAGIETQLKEYLGPDVSAAVVPIAERQEVVVFVQESSTSKDDCIAALPTSTNTEGTLSDLLSSYKDATIPVSIAAALKKFDKFAQHSLPTSSVPAAYVIVEGELERQSLSQLAARISQGDLKIIRAGLEQAWNDPRLTLDDNATAAESILRAAWAKILGIDRPELIDTQDNFFRLGGDSVLAMKLVSYLGSQGHKLTVADIFRHMKLADAAKKLKVKEATVEVKEVSRPYQPFSMLPVAVENVESFLSEVVRPQLADAAWPIKDVYPVTDSQVLDIRNTIQKPRTSMQYLPLYFPDGIDQERLLYAFKRLVRTHDILRTVFISHESSFLQVVLSELDVPVTTATLTDGTITLEEYVKNLCAQASDGEFHLGSSFLRVFFVNNKQQSCLVIGLSHAQYDGMTIPIFLHDLEALYTKFDGINPTSVVPFSSYLWSIQDDTAQKEAAAYWEKLLDGASLSVLDRPSLSAESEPKAGVFKSTPVNVSSRSSSSSSGVTTSTILTTAWALVLSRRLGTNDITFGSITSGRGMNLPGLPNPHAVVGPCYQFTPVRVTLPQGEHSSAQELSAVMQATQAQTAESSAYDFFGSIDSQGERATFFDSVVHHQDEQAADFEEMKFAGGRCKADLLSPHGDDARYSLKVVTFYDKDGVLNVGVVGRDGDEEGGFLDSLLGDLKGCVEELYAVDATRV
ncbi:nonribosomal siderophore peptide synthase Sid2 [Naviculisporaceae sp. PSN 640]